ECFLSTLPHSSTIFYYRNPTTNRQSPCALDLPAPVHVRNVRWRVQVRPEKLWPSFCLPGTTRLLSFRLRQRPRSCLLLFLDCLCHAESCDGKGLGLAREMLVLFSCRSFKDLLLP